MRLLLSLKLTNTSSNNQSCKVTGSMYRNGNLSAIGSAACPISVRPVKSHHWRFAEAIKCPVISHRINNLLMYNILCLGLSDPSNCSRNADHQFSGIYNCYVQWIFILYGRGLKTFKSGINRPALMVNKSVLTLPRCPTNTADRTRQTDFIII